MGVSPTVLLGFRRLHEDEDEAEIVRSCILRVRSFEAGHMLGMVGRMSGHVRSDPKLE